MSESSDSTERLLSELVALQKDANASQLRTIENAEKYQTETRERIQASIRLQETAVARQQRFVRLWGAMLVIVFAAIVYLIYKVYPAIH